MSIRHALKNIPNSVPPALRAQPREDAADPYDAGHVRLELGLRNDAIPSGPAVCEHRPRSEPFACCGEPRLQSTHGDDPQIVAFHGELAEEDLVGFVHESSDFVFGLGDRQAIVHELVRQGALNPARLPGERVSERLQTVRARALPVIEQLPVSDLLRVCSGVRVGLHLRFDALAVPDERDVDALGVAHDVLHHNHVGAA
ncbi:hypothetical protein emb_1c0709 [Coriobacteriaceae bacterium EMTCatB1]|nr:hypothetical protein emb_1c0709 [Coriobacteriaceae bacterium EMTCatB1]